MKWLSDDIVNNLRTVAVLPDLSNTKYECIEKIASGGMGTIYLVEDTQLHRNIALKLLDIPDSKGDLANRVLREARVIASLEHPGIVPIHDVGTLQDGRVFYTMKNVNGDRLDQYAVKTDSLTDLLRIFQKICEAVEFAHAQGVIHRDLKPENIMVGDFGEVLVMDWGLAKILTSNDQTDSRSRKQPASLSLLSSDTQNGTVLGTPAYMAPEQARGEIDQMDERTDIYALGAILYFLLTGSPPFEQKSEHLDRELLLQANPKPPRRINRKIPRQMEAICLKALSKEKQDRFHTVHDLATDIELFLNGLPVSSHRENIFEKFGRWLDRNRFIVILVLIYIIVRFLIFFWAKP